MKKNKMLRTASVLLILVMLTTSIIGGTFAKYTTTGKVSDTARVAKWGVVINTSGALFSDAYAKKTDTGGNLPTAWNANPSADSITVAAGTEKANIVAPGTKSYANGLSFGISGKPEVAVEVSATIKAEDIFLKTGTYGVLVPATVSDAESLKKVINSNTDGGVYKAKTATPTTYEKLEESETYAAGTTYYILTNKVVLAENYFPVEYALEGQIKYGADDAKTAVKAAELLTSTLKATTTPAAPTAEGGDTNKDYKATYSEKKTFPANTDLGTAGPKFQDANLKWEWKFEKGDDDTAKTNNNAADTFLGDLIAARGLTGDHKFVFIATSGDTETVTELTFGTDEDYTVKSNDAVVANLRTSFDIDLSVTQVD